MQFIVLLAFPFVMWYMNRIRGSKTTAFLPESWGIQKILPNGAPFAAVAILICMLLYTGDPIASFAIAAVWLAFESFGWGKWAASVPLWGENAQAVYNRTMMAEWPNTGKSTGIHWVANAIFPEDKEFTGYAILALFLRGMLWFGPVYAVLVGFGLVTVPMAVAATVLMGFAFPGIYKMSCDYNAPTEWYGKAENYYGFVQGLVMSGAILLGAYGI